MKAIDITRKRFERLTALYLIHKIKNDKKVRYWHCICDCGNYTDVTASNLIHGKTKSCGCYSSEVTKDRFKIKNKYDLTGDYGVGYTSNNEEFYFDLEDYDKIKDFCWYKEKAGYISTNYYVDKTKKNIKMHRLILNVEDIKNKDIDHINWIKYDNRKNNLRVCTHQQNTINVEKKKNNTSGTVGVSYRKDRNKWRAEINFKNTYIYLGMYDNKEDAIKARRNAEEKYFGDFFNHETINKGEDK